MKPKKAQAWGTDLIIAFTIFSFAIIFFYFYSFNYSNETEDILELLTYEGNFIADSLLSPGYPDPWQESDVIEIGLTTDGKINQTKLNTFYEFTQNDYERTKRIFGTKHDYYFFMGNPINSTLEGIGKPGVNSTTITSSNIMKITRLTIYQNKPTTAYVYIFKQ